MEEEQDAGVAQLWEVFDACDTERTGRLDARGLQLLCHRLQLANRAPALVHHLLGRRQEGGDGRPAATVSFEQFKEGFISILTEAEDEPPPSESVTSDVPGAPSEAGESQEAPGSKKDREVSPKYVLGEKKYGRRSRPVSQADVDVEISSDEDFSADEVLGPAMAESAGNVAPKADPSDTQAKTSSSAPKATAGILPTGLLSYPESSFDDAGQFPGKFSSGDFSSASGLSKDSAEGMRELASEGPLMPPALFATGFDIASSPMFGQSFTVGGGSESAESSLTLLETNPEEYLRATWRKLNVGSNGYLHVDELAGVCEHIGMEMDEEMIGQLFHTLDSDQDGKISFQEFLQGMFQHGRAPGSRSVTPPPLTSPLPLVPPSPTPCAKQLGPSEHSAANKPTGSPGHHRHHPSYRRNRGVQQFKDTAAADDEMSDKPVSGAVVPIWESGIFSSIDPDNTGYAESQAVVSFWESLGLTGCASILKQLGFNPNLKVSLQDLTAQLEEEMSSVAAGNASTTYAFALASYQHELKHLKTNFEQAREERDRLRVNVAEANARSALIAQEVDEHHARMEKASENRLLTLEKRHTEQLREVTEELQRERETTTLQLTRLRQRNEDELSALRAEELRLRAQLATLEQENCRLELELQEYSERYRELHRLGESQQKELESVGQLKQKIADLESGQTFLNDEHYQKILQELEVMRKQNKELKDSNDELTLELETLRQQLNSGSGSRSSAHGKRHRRSGSWVSDYSRQGGLKRRGSEASSSEESDDDIPIAGKIRKRAGFSASTGSEGLWHELTLAHSSHSILPCVADAYQLTLDADELGEAQREPLERLRARFEQALRDIEERWRQRVADLEAQLCGQPEVDKDSIDCAQSTIAKLQDELSMRSVLAERLRADVTALQNQLAQQREQLAAELSAREHEVAQLGELKRASETTAQALQAKLEEAQKKAADESNSKREAWNAEREALLASIEVKAKQLNELKRSLAEATASSGTVGRLQGDAEASTAAGVEGETPSMQAMYESKLAEVRCQVEQDLVRKVRTDVERELRTSLEQNLRLQPSRRDSDPQSQLRRPQDLTAQLTEDICQLLRQCLRCGAWSTATAAAGTDGDAETLGGARNQAGTGGASSTPRDGGDPGASPHSVTSGASLQEQLASLIGKAIGAIEAHLETLHLQEHDRLRKNCEEQLQRLKQKHMMERLECELQHNEELERLRKQHQHQHHQHQHLQQQQSGPASQQQPCEQQQHQPSAVGPSKIDTLLRDLYVENARLLRALQRAEDGRRRAEHNSTRLQYKCRVLSKLLTDVTRAAVDGSRVACA
ncbi:ninein-like protein isoform X2 [Dermacentor albipictus]|uniref:ninein-like protein isoform X2 n=1 Tax=Dermacentor albipictus TaxID=60249 RepID=UPI0038FC72E3